MGVKGDRASKEPLAIRFYAEGHGLAEIGRQLDISVVTLSKWKSEALAPGAEMDEWDRARQQKRGNIQRLKDLFERQLKYIEELPPDGVTPPMMDTMSKLGALVERWDRVEKTKAAADEVIKEVKKAGLSDEAANDIRKRILGIGE